MTQSQPYIPTAREQKFLESVEDASYKREIISGLGPFFHEKAPADMLNFYSKDEVARLQALKGTERDVESRMPVKITRHYYELARTSAAMPSATSPAVAVPAAATIVAVSFALLVLGGLWSRVRPA